MPHVWLSPLLTCTKSTLPAATRVGVSRCRPTLSPSSPCWLRPQQYATCDALTPHVWSRPALTVTNAWPPATAAGAERLLNVESPTPLPQQYAYPATVMPQLRALPVVTDTNVRWPTPALLEAGSKPAGCARSANPSPARLTPRFETVPMPLTVCT